MTATGPDIRARFGSVLHGPTVPLAGHEITTWLPGMIH
ncbi:hypothetical protein Q427_02370 [Halomonas sp. BC04]|nr:hypothetical protein Q427_02370 [Halomonas sp. BC04]